MHSIVNNAAYDLDDPYHMQDVHGFDMSVASLFPPQFFDPSCNILANP
jgi:hypothetical protein